MIRITAFRWVPPFAQGLSRDLRLRWALEEAGLPYEVRQIGFEDRDSKSYRGLQPFGQVPVYEEDGLVLFESAAILHHIARRSEALMSLRPDEAARTTTWLFAAMNTLEPHVQNLVEIDLFYPKEEWAKARRPKAVAAVKKRLDGLSDWLDGRDYLERRFTVADLLMSLVLEALRHTDLVAEVPTVDAYRLRCQARPAYAKALADHLAAFAGNEPAAA
jgi:glutathione S-transferase